MEAALFKADLELIHSFNKKNFRKMKIFNFFWKNNVLNVNINYFFFYNICNSAIVILLNSIGDMKDIPKMFRFPHHRPSTFNIVPYHQDMYFFKFSFYLL